MINFNLEGLDKIENLDLNGFWNWLGGAGILVFFFIIIFAIGIVFLWVFSSVGIMNLAKKNNLPNAWFAFLPIARSYLVGKLGFEIYADDDKKNSTLTWVTLGLAAGAFLLGSDNDIHDLATLGLLVFESWAFYNMFKVLNEKNSIVYTVFTVLTRTLLGGVFLYVIKDKEEVTEQFKEAEVISETKEEKNEEKKEVKKNDEKTAQKFCFECGAKLNKNMKFCPECGHKIK